MLALADGRGGEPVPADVAVDGGTIDAGPDASLGDGGALGEGECAASCGVASTTKPSADCSICLREATGTKKDPGSCYKTVSTACAASAECTAFTTCVATCTK